MNQRVLIVTARGALADDVIEKLQWGGYRVSRFIRLDEARIAAKTDCDLVLLDLAFERDPALAFIQDVRSSSDTLIVLLGERGRSSWEVVGLRTGADGRVAPSLAVDELLAYLGAFLRRPALRRGTSVSIGELTLDHEKRQCRIRDQRVVLTRVEFDLLAALAQRRGSIVTRRWLATNVLHDWMESAERNLGAHISHLRRKLGDTGQLIETVRGVGYRLRRTAPSAEAKTDGSV